MIASPHQQRGITILEALIAGFVFAFGLLGLVSLQARAQVSEAETLARTQALLLLDGMAARLSANRPNAAAYVTTTPVGTDDTEPADCSSLAVGAPRDLCEWSAGLKGATETFGGSRMGAVPSGRGCIEAIDGANPPAYRITVAWQGMSATVPSVFACGQGSYGADAQRRVVTTIVAIASLTP